MVEHSPIEILKRYWGYPVFRELQEDIVQSLMAGKHTVALLPTGGGKSICFQVPALCMPGICIVVSPLIALMKDQVYQLKKRGIKAIAIYSGMSKREIDHALDNCIFGDFKFLYVSPERMKTDLFLARSKKMQINMLAIDEAHCISQWGYDFRPPYLEIANFIEELKIEKVIALTASATREVKEDIISKLGLKEAVVFKKSFARSNLSYSVFDLENKDQKMVEILTNVKGSAIVYVRSRKRTQLIAQFLRKHGISSDYYHAGLTSDERSKKQDAWIHNQVRVMVATNAFGMGIDKPDVRSVVHYDLPDSLEAYYQEAGRAGRDERKAYAVALFHKVDIENLEKRTEQMAVSVELIRRVYQALANYYKLAVGSNALTCYTFDYEQFTKNFNLPTVETYYALNKLQDEGLIQISDVFHPTSRLLFLLSHEEVYRFQVAHSAVDRIIKALMRLYGGELFSDYQQIQERDLAKLLKESENAIYKQLEYLHQSEIVEYQRGNDRPQITFLTPRYEMNSLPLNKEQIAWRKQVAFDKTKAVVGYMTSAKSCRTRVIQNYFDEISEIDCGVCDVCLNKKKLQQQDLPTDEVLRLLASTPLTYDQIRSGLLKYAPTQIEQAVRYLLEMDFITLEGEVFRKSEG
jgi:ATP-dependent DNA helicase RecQ